MMAKPCPVTLHGMAMEGIVQTPVNRPCLKLKGHNGNHIVIVPGGYREFPAEEKR